MAKVIKITGLYSLKSRAPYDYAGNITEGKCHDFQFCEYNQTDGN